MAEDAEPKKPRLDDQEGPGDAAEEGAPPSPSGPGVTETGWVMHLRPARCGLIADCGHGLGRSGCGTAQMEA
jgi:hypothetical protein